MTQEAKTEAEKLQKSYAQVVDGEFAMWGDYHAVTVDMIRRIKELEKEIGRYRNKANTGSDEGH
jgi:hypothetical protein